MYFAKAIITVWMIADRHLLKQCTIANRLRQGYGDCDRDGSGGTAGVDNGGIAP